MKARPSERHVCALAKYMEPRMDFQERGISSSRRYIETFVFTDLETTGFIQRGNAGIVKYPNITEISLVAVQRGSLLSSSTTGSLPRVVSKLTLPVNPGKIVDPHIYQLTGLDNQNLEQAVQFLPKVGAAVKAFLTCLTPPSCLIAHNGDQFDFPILIHHLGKLTDDLGSLLCADSLKAFQELDCVSPLPASSQQCAFGDGTTVQQQENEMTPPRGTTSLERSKVHSLSESASWSRVARKKLEFACAPSWVDLELDILLSSDEERRLSISNVECNKEVVKSVAVEAASSIKKRGIGETSISVVASNYSPCTPPKLKSSPALATSKPSPSYKLSNVYQRLWGLQSAFSHGAEADAETVLRCARFYGPRFVEWCELGARGISSLKVQP